MEKGRFGNRISLVTVVVATLLMLVVIALFVGLAWGKPNLLKPAILGLLAGLTVLFAVCLVIALYREDELSLESRWRGFGGGLGGWRASAALGLLIAVIVFGCLTVFASMALQPDFGGTSPTSGPTVAATATPTPTPPVK